ncbi:DUF3099 domain-containing protein [Zafaria sp. Z1313]|uniref:DUF3099 domain-containing protein n=1 Tax=Zafaria sp. Z1313 TaxID=3423202 RepID=UPI003D3030D5
MTQHANHGHRRPDAGAPVHNITDATASHSEEMHARMVKYSVSMGIRLACFIAAFFTHGWLQWAFLAGAIFLPWFAVVIANGGTDRSRQPASTVLLDSAPLTALGPGSTTPGPGQAHGGAPGATPENDGADGTPRPGSGDPGTPGGGAAGEGDGPGVVLEGELAEDPPRARPADGAA